MNNGVAQQINSEDELPLSNGNKKADFFIGDGRSSIVEFEDPYSPEYEESPHIVPPDGGYGWVVVAASFACNLIVDGIIFTFGILLMDINDTFQEGISQTALIGSLLSGVYLIVGPFVSALANRFGFRTVAIMGSLIGCFGFILSYFATSVTYLCITYGIIGGIGFGFVYVPSVIAVGFYFEKRRALATGVAVCGSGIGTFLMAPLTINLIDYFGWRGTLLIQAGIILNCAVFGALFRPIQPVKIDFRNRIDSEQEETEPRKPLLFRIKEARDHDFVTSMSDASLASYTIMYDKAPMPLPTPASNLSFVRPKRSFSKSECREMKKLNSSPSLTKIARTYDRVNKRMSVPGLESSGANAEIVGIQLQSNFPSLIDTKVLEEEEPPDEEEEIPLAITNQTIIEEPQSSSDVEEPLEIVHSVGPSTNTKQELVNGKISNTDNNVSVNTIDNNKNTPYCENRNSESTTKHRRKSSLRRKYSAEEGMRPFYREDIFFSASLVRLPQYASSRGSIHASITHVPTLLEIEEHDREHRCCSLPFMKTLSAMLDVSLLSSPTFLLLCFSGFLTLMGLFVPFMYLADRAMKSGLSKSSAAFLLSLIGIMNTAARVVCGWISDMPRINALLINNIALTVGGFATLITPFFESHIMLLMYAGIFGISLACFASLRSIILVELMGLDKLTNAFGLLLLCQGIAATIGAPVAGAFYDSTGNYDYSFFLSGTLILISGIICFPLNIINKWEKRRNSKAPKVKIIAASNENVHKAQAV